MVKRTGGNRRKTRSILRKHYSLRGKISLRKYFQEFKKGDRVGFKAEPAIHKGMYFRRYNGKTGVIECKRGNCYEIKIKDRNKEKMLIVHPVHLNKL